MAGRQRLPVLPEQLELGRTEPVVVLVRTEVCVTEAVYVFFIATKE